MLLPHREETRQETIDSPPEREQSSAKRESAPITTIQTTRVSGRGKKNLRGGKEHKECTGRKCLKGRRHKRLFTAT